MSTKCICENPDIPLFQVIVAKPANHIVQAKTLEEAIEIAKQQQSDWDFSMSRNYITLHAEQIPSQLRPFYEHWGHQFWDIKKI